jgi:hypothetical protein
VNRRRAAIVNAANITKTGGIGGGPNLPSRRRRFGKTTVIPAKAH